MVCGVLSTHITFYGIRPIASLDSSSDAPSPRPPPPHPHPHPHSTSCMEVHCAVFSHGTVLNFTERLRPVHFYVMSPDLGYFLQCLITTPGSKTDKMDSSYYKQLNSYQRHE